jgi:Flp pilus assembly protein TadD
MSWRCYVASFLLGLTLSAFAREPDWVEVRSPHFSVVTDAGEKRGREEALHFEQMRAVFAALMTRGAKVTLPIPLQIVAFRSTKEMRQFVPLWKGKPVKLAGLFEGNDDRTFILLDMSVENPWQVVFHEYAHQLMNGNLSVQVDPWFEEGFAEYFSSIEVDSKEVRVGKIPAEEYEILIQSGMMKVADLFRVQHNSSTYNENGDHRTVFYAQSGLVMHYLYDNQFLLKVATYFDSALNKKMPVEDAIQQAFGMSAAQFDKTLPAYLGSGHYKYYPIPTPPGIATEGYTVKPLAFPDAQAVLADMHLHSADYQDKAVAEFEEVLKLQPDHPAALRGLGYAYLMKQDFPHAGEYFRKAAEHDSNDPRVLYYSALLVQREQGAGCGNDRQELDVIQKRLEKSVALDPDFADAYSLLAFAYSSQGKHEQALETMKKAVALNPRNDAYAFNLAQMYLVNQKFDEAVTIFEPLRQSSNPQLAAQVVQAISVAQNAKLAAAAGMTIDVSSGPGHGPGNAHCARARAGDCAVGNTNSHDPGEC